MNAGTVVRWREQTLSVDQYLLVARHAAPGTDERLLLDQYVVTNDTKLSSIWNLVLSHPDLASKATVLEADGGSLAMLTCSQSADSSGLAGILVHGLLRTSLWQSPERAARLLDRIIVDGERSILPGYHVEEWIGFELTGDWTITPGTILSPTEDPPRRLRPYDGDISVALRNVRHEHRATMLTVEQAFNWGPIIYAGTEPPPFGAQLSRKSEALTISNIMAICSLVLNSRIDVQCKRHMHEPEELWDVTGIARGGQGSHLRTVDQNWHPERSIAEDEKRQIEQTIANLQTASKDDQREILRATEHFAEALRQMNDLRGGNILCLAQALEPTVNLKSEDYKKVDKIRREIERDFADGMFSVPKTEREFLDSFESFWDTRNVIVHGGQFDWVKSTWYAADMRAYIRWKLMDRLVVNCSD